MRLVAGMRVIVMIMRVIVTMRVAAFGAVNVVMVVMVMITSRPRPWCSYVGDDGVSDHRVELFGPHHRLLCFEDSSALFIARTDHSENGVYRQTTIKYCWRRGGRDKHAIHLFAAEIGDLALALTTMREVAGIDTGVT